MRQPPCARFCSLSTRGSSARWTWDKSQSGPRSRTRPTVGSGPSALAHFLGGERLHEVDDRPAHFRVADAHEGPVELQTLAAVQEIDDVVFALAIGEPGGCIGRAFADRDILIEEGDADAEQLAELVQTAGTDPVDALLVLLDLLEREPQ